MAGGKFLVCSVEIAFRCHVSLFVVDKGPTSKLFTSVEANFSVVLRLGMIGKGMWSKGGGRLSDKQNAYNLPIKPPWVCNQTSKQKSEDINEDLKKED